MLEKFAQKEFGFAPTTHDCLRLNPLRALRPAVFAGWEKHLEIVE